MKHARFYWWDRTGSKPMGPFDNAEAAKFNALENAYRNLDVLILHEESFAGPVINTRKWEDA